jgi:riboflavin kinase/FMN adenylyltransferase
MGSAAEPPRLRGPRRPGTMKRYFDLETAASDRRNSVERAATIGFFDGVHAGHRKVVAELTDWARATGSEPVVITFDRHPQSVLGGHPPVPVVSLEHRLLLLEREDLAATLVLRFDRELASWSPETFVERVLRDALGVRRLLMGFDSAFGKGREGTFEYLRDRREALGLEVRQTSAELIDGERVSSTLIRSLVAAGDFERVERLLGRRYSLLGRVVAGDRRGRELGFPTANLDVREQLALPRGVYFAEVARLGSVLEPAESLPAGRLERALDPGELLPAVVNVGRAPTLRAGIDAAPDDSFDPARDRVEVHVIDPPDEFDVYGEFLEVFVDLRHRSERRFESPAELRAAIANDVAARRRHGLRPQPLS